MESSCISPDYVFTSSAIIRDFPAGCQPGGERTIINEPELTFFDQVPAIWDDTKVIESDIGKYGIVACRHPDQADPCI